MIGKVGFVQPLEDLGQNTTNELHNLILHLNELISLKEIIIKSHVYYYTYVFIYYSKYLSAQR